MKGSNLAGVNAASRARREARIEDAHYLAGAGEHPEHIAARMGISAYKLEEYLRCPVAVPDAGDPGGDGEDGPVPALDPERRIARAKPLAADLAHCVAATDAEGVRLLLHRVRDWTALVIVLAECADPGRTAVVTETGVHAAARREQEVAA